jgi:hypothetical protein
MPGASRKPENENENEGATLRVVHGLDARASPGSVS